MQLTYALLYFEINLVSVLITVIILIKTAGLSRMASQRQFAMAIYAEMVFFLSDSFFVMIYRGGLPYNTFWLLLMKVLYFFSTTWMCFAWFLYFEHLQEAQFVRDKKKVLYSSVLLIIMVILLIINGFTGILFYVDDAGVYQRGPWFLVQYFLSYIYVFITCFRALLGAFKPQNYAKRDLLFSLAAFPIAPAIAGIIQFIRSDIPVACVALSIATLIMYLNSVEQMISLDPLTQLNNRRQFMRYFSQKLKSQSTSGETGLYLMLIDVNKFKYINDTFGHVEGDEALKRVADALRRACGDMKRRANIARFGGDEFIILVESDQNLEIDVLKTRIQTILSDLNKEAGSRYPLNVSIGISVVDNARTLKEIIEAADERLYEEKRAGRIK